MRALSRILTLAALLILPSGALAEEDDTERQKSSNFFERDYVNKAMLTPADSEPSNETSSEPEAPPTEAPPPEEKKQERSAEAADRWEIAR
jgi:hypothetical protein